MGKIIVIGSQKGGVGKTTTTLNLAHSLQQMGKKVLTVDFDSQANLTTCYGVEDTGALEYTIGHLMMAQIEEEVPESFEDYIRSREGVDYILSSIYLSVVDAKLRTEMGAERMLAEVLEPLKSRYDYILIDTCPSLGMLTINALATADEVIITVNPQLLAMMGLQDFLRTIGKIKKRINPKLEVAGILLTICESRTTLCKVLTEEVTGSFRGKIRVFDTRIPATVKSTKKRYGRAWKRIRDKYAAEHPFCELCFEHGIIVPAEEIHHKLPLSEGGTHDRSNLIALCKSCHSTIHAKRGDYWGQKAPAKPASWEEDEQ